jgi:hypothetical protein
MDSRDGRQRPVRAVGRSGVDLLHDPVHAILVSRRSGDERSGGDRLLVGLLLLDVLTPSRERLSDPSYAA